MPPVALGAGPIYDALKDPSKQRVVVICHSQGTIIMAQVLLLSVVMLCGIIVQAAKGYFRFELGLYVKSSRFLQAEALRYIHRDVQGRADSASMLVMLNAMRAHNAIAIGLENDARSGRYPLIMCPPIVSSPAKYTVVVVVPPTLTAFFTRSPSAS